MASVAVLLANSLTGALPGYGFASAVSSDACSLFIRKINDFATTLGKFYDDAIEEQMSSRGCKKSREDLISWAHAISSKIVFEALARYRDRITDSELITLPREKISCEVALTYSYLLADLTEEVRKEAQIQYEVPPKSSKYARKRKQHSFRPYGVPVEFPILRSVLRWR